MEVNARKGGRMFRKVAHVLVVLALTISVIACDKGPTAPTPKPQDPTPTPTVAITGGASTMRAGEETTFTAVANGQPVAANWSTNPGSAQLIPTAGSATTKFAPTAEGKYTVTATAPGANPGTTTVTVTAPLPVPPFGELGMELAYGGRTAIRPPVIGPVTFVVPPEAAPHSIPASFLNELASFYGVPTVTSTQPGGGDNVFVSVQSDSEMDRLCGTGAGACLAGNQYYLRDWFRLGSPTILHEGGHRLLYHCTTGRPGCQMMATSLTVATFSSEEKAVARFVQNGGK